MEFRGETYDDCKETFVGRLDECIAAVNALQERTQALYAKWDSGEEKPQRGGLRITGIVQPDGTVIPVDPDAS